MRFGIFQSLAVLLAAGPLDSADDVLDNQPKESQLELPRLDDPGSSSFKDLLDILAKESRVMTIIKAELQEIKAKHATPRKTEIVPDEGEIAIEDLIANEGVIITLTHNGLIKRTNVSSYRAQKREELRSGVPPATCVSWISMSVDSVRMCTSLFGKFGRPLFAR